MTAPTPCRTPRRTPRRTPLPRDNDIFSQVLDASAITSTPSSRRRAHQPEPSSGEVFVFSDDDDPFSTPNRRATPRSTLQRHVSDVTTPSRSVPRSGPHSQHRLPKSPKKKRKNTKANDVWRFCKPDPMNRKGTGSHMCMLCR